MRCTCTRQCRSRTSTQRACLPAKCRNKADVDLDVRYRWLLVCEEEGCDECTSVRLQLRGSEGSYIPLDAGRLMEQAWSGKHAQICRCMSQSALLVRDTQSTNSNAPIMVDSKLDNSPHCHSPSSLCDLLLRARQQDSGRLRIQQYLTCSSICS